MWCKHCQQDVPGIMAGGEEAYSCPRCFSLPRHRPVLSDGRGHPFRTERCVSILAFGPCSPARPSTVGNGRDAAVRRRRVGHRGNRKRRSFAGSHPATLSGNVWNSGGADNVAVAATPPQPAIQTAAAVVTEYPPAEVPETRPQSADTAAFKHIEVAERSSRRSFGLSRYRKHSRGDHGKRALFRLRDAGAGSGIKDRCC